jgi:hypothetical protein
MTVEIKGLEELMKKVKTLEDLEGVKAGLRAGALYLKGKVAKYPPRRHGVRMQFTSDRQRRGFFAKLRSGEIEVPYRRGQSPGSQALGRKWTISNRNQDLTAIVAQEEGTKVVELVTKEVDRLLAK